MSNRPDPFDVPVKPGAAKALISGRNETTSDSDPSNSSSPPAQKATKKKPTTKKKQSKAKPASDPAPDTKPLHTVVSYDLWKSIKIIAIEENTTTSDLVRSVLGEFVAQKNKNR